VYTIDIQLDKFNNNTNNNDNNIHLFCDIFALRATLVVKFMVNTSIYLTILIFWYLCALLFIFLFFWVTM